ncbi:MAG: SRPBCC domain-containing protein [Bacteroidales bacterium]|nr:SRPBCC domain-containing protein [Bacteroidales bacterium]
MAANISTILINATPDAVWDVLTNPEKVKLWQFGSDLITSWEVGTTIKFETEWKGQIFKQWGKILEIKQNELIKYSLFAPLPDLEDKPENYFVMSYVLTAENGQTKLEIIQEDNRPDAVQEEPQGEDNPVLKMLKAIAESNLN